MLTPRRAMLLLWRLPSDSWTLTEIRDSVDPGELDEVKSRGHGRWSHEAMLLAQIDDDLRVNTWATGQWKKPPPVPKPIPRPGVGERVLRARNVEDVKAAADPRVLAYAEALRNRDPLPDL